MRKLSALLLPLLCASACFGKLHHIYESERSDVLDGVSFGAAGPYERIVGEAFFRVDPSLPANKIIRDIQFAPRAEDGMVEFSASIYVLKPRDPAKGNGTVLFEVSNRGGKAMLSMFNRGRGSRDPKLAEEFGDRMLLEQGFTLVWLGWQFDVPNRPDLIKAHVPIARDGQKPITGLVRAEYVPDHKVVSFMLSDREHEAYRVLDPSDPHIQLTVRDRRDGERRAIARSQWTFPDPTHISMASGFQPGRIYEVVYTAADPPIAGLGLAGIRDTIAFFKHGEADSLLEDQHNFIKRAIGFGISQSGRVLRHFLYDGFNADEKNRKVFDGVWAHVAGAGRGSFNMRFAQPSRDGQAFANLFYPVDLLPFTDREETDPETGAKGGLLDRAIAANVAPKIFYTNGSYEYWGRAAALIHTTPDGRQDAPIANDTRIYFNAGAQHGAGAFPPPRPNTHNSADPLDYRYQMRALLMAMQGWLKDAKEPPASQYPLVGKDQLATLGSLQFPKIAGIEVPKYPATAYRLDFGPEFSSAGIVSVEPPKLGKPYPVLVPQVDVDGNDQGGIRLPEIQVPLGTYTGWNQRDQSLGAPDQMIAFLGSFIPFAKTKVERIKAKDPRLSIEERYSNRQEYLEKISAAAKSLAASGYVLESDVPALIERARTQWDYLTK
jgi:hypothetical protein